MYEREKREAQENSLYENCYAQNMLKTGKINEYLLYLQVMNEKCKNGMTNDEIEAVERRAENAAKAHG